MAEEGAVEGVGFLDGVAAFVVVAVGGGDDLFVLPVELHDAFGGGQLTGCGLMRVDDVGPDIAAIGTAFDDDFADVARSQPGFLGSGNLREGYVDS